MAIIEIHGLSKTFGSGDEAVTALSDIDLSINEGEIFGIIGLSGAGKSTLVRCINLLERPDAGSVCVCGVELTELTQRQLLQARRSIGMIFQGFNLLMQSTALENVMFPLLISGVKRAAAKKRAGELLTLVGLGERGSAYPAQLSGGQKQRVAIARTLATDPRILLCDEATSALDPSTTESILQLLRDINRQLGVTVVIITHEMRVIEKICSRVAIISDSRIVEVGDVGEIFQHPKTAEAKSLLFPKSNIDAFKPGSRSLRLVFDGYSADRPVVANMVLSCGGAVNILFADTKIIDGKSYGQMIVQLPEDSAKARRMLAFLDAENVTYEEEIHDVH